MNKKHKDLKISYAAVKNGKIMIRLENRRTDKD